MSDLVRRFEKLETKIKSRYAGTTHLIPEKTLVKGCGLEKSVQDDMDEFKKILQKADALLRTEEFEDDGLGID